MKTNKLKKSKIFYRFRKNRIFFQKKGIMVEALVTMIIAIIVFVGVFSIGRSFFRISSQAEQSFDQFVELIERVNTEGGAESMNLIMDQKTALIGFAKDSDKVICKEFLNQIDGFFNIPTNCEKNKACICLCTSGFKPKGTAYYDEEGKREGFRKIEYECKKIKCNFFESIDFLNKIDEDDFGSYPSGVDPLKKGNYYTLLNGFMHTREGPDHLPGMSTRNNQIYVEKYKNIISVCFKYPCISEEMKNERTSVTIKEAEEANFMFIPGWMIGVDYTLDDDYLDTFYYIEDTTKDIFGNYYYKYKFGTKPLPPNEEQAGFLETPQEKTKQEFESKIINYAKDGKSVKIDYDNTKADINSFESETEINEEGKFIEVDIGGSW